MNQNVLKQIVDFRGVVQKINRGTGRSVFLRLGVYSGAGVYDVL